jgi:hypothetical protein
MAAYLESSAIREEAHWLEVMTTLQAAQSEIARLTAALEEHRNREIALRFAALANSLAAEAPVVKRREADLTAEVEYQRSRVAELGRRLAAANDQADHDTAALLAAEQAKGAAERALKALQDQVVGALASVRPAPNPSPPRRRGR